MSDEQTRTTLSNAALDYLCWLRDNEHHFATWLPKNAPPGKVTHIELRGYEGRRKRVSAATHEEVRDYKTIYPPAHLARERMFYPNEAGLAFLGAEGADHE